MRPETSDTHTWLRPLCLEASSMAQVKTAVTGKDPERSTPAGNPFGSTFRTDPESQPFSPLWPRARFLQLRPLVSWLPPSHHVLPVESFSKVDQIPFLLCPNLSVIHS